MTPREDPKDTGQGEFQDSKTVLENVLRVYPQYRKECSPGLSTLINFANVSNVRKIKCYQFNKIRICLDAIEKKEGYPARRHHTVAFFDLLMFSTPFYKRLAVMDTIQLWDDGQLSKEKPWRVRFVDVGSRFYVWRQVVTFDIPDEYQSVFLGLIPSKIDDSIVNTLLRLTSDVWPIFENLVSYGGLHNYIILCNWDKVVRKLNKGGF